MLFRKKIQKSCSYCLYGTELEGGDVLCTRKGIVSVDGKCRKFDYDPCKRIPLRQLPPDFSKYDGDDFSIDS